MGDGIPPGHRDQALDLPVQGDLFDDGSFGVELAELDKPETRHGKHTGAELERRTIVRDQVLKWLGQGVGVHRIRDVLVRAGVPIGVNSILAFKNRRRDLVETEKKRFSQGLGDLVELSIESMKKRLIEGTWKPGSVDLGILIDKKAAIDGEANLVVEHRFTADASADAFRKRLDEFKKAKGIAVESDSPVIDLKPQ